MHFQYCAVCMLCKTVCMFIYSSMMMLTQILIMIYPLLFLQKRYITSPDWSLVYLLILQRRESIYETRHLRQQQDAAYFCALKLDAEKNEKKKAELVNEQNRKEVKCSLVKFGLKFITVQFLNTLKSHLKKHSRYVHEGKRILFRLPDTRIIESVFVHDASSKVFVYDCSIIYYIIYRCFINTCSVIVALQDLLGYLQVFLGH